MKFTATTLTTVFGLIALVAAIPQGSESITAAPTSVSVYVDPARASTLSCIAECGPGNVYCQAACQGLPTPDERAVNATNDCVAACPPGGDDEKNAAWAECQRGCIASFYYTASASWSSYVLPTPAGVTSSEEAVATDASTATGTNSPSATAGSKSSGTSSAPSATSSNAGSAVLVNMPILSAFGLFLAAFAL